ncbi:MAG: ribonucleotide-diphosphate reductase subunit beta [Mycoplasma sp.]
MKKETKLINLNCKTSIQDQKIFFGKYNGFQRYDIYNHNFSKVIERAMRQAFWTPEEISMLHDRENFKTLPDHIQEILIHNILFQTLMDSGQNRGLDKIMAEIVTASEWEAVFKTQAFFELIHSLSYSHILREMFPSNASEIFDRVYDIEQIKNRINKEVYAYDEIEELLNTGKLIESPENKKKILNLLIHIYFLEGLKFYISFMVTYMINSAYKDAIPGVTKIIKLINFDEDMHVAVVSGLINILKTSEENGFCELFSSGWFEEQSYEIVDGIVKDELQWGKFLLDFGPVPGLTTEVFKEFMNYYANDRLRIIGLDAKYTVSKNVEIIEWFKMYKDINKDNTAQQEAQALNYNIGTMTNDIENEDLSEALKDLNKIQATE